MELIRWLSGNWFEIFGALTGVVFVFLEIRQSTLLWPVGIVTSAVYIIVFFTTKFYADMSLQVYYLVISLAGWYWWVKGAGFALRNEMKEGRKAQGARFKVKGEGVDGQRSVINTLPGSIGESEYSFENSPLEGPALTEASGGQGDVKLKVARLRFKTGLILTTILAVLYFIIWFILSRFTDSPVPGWDSFITSLSVVATWMLARKIFEHWYLWIVVNLTSTVIFLIKGLYPTAVLYLVYLIMSFVGLKAWKRSL